MVVQVRVIEDCLKLHGQLCPQEMLPFHETLEKFFRKNFQDEIRRLAANRTSDHMTASPNHLLPDALQSQASLYEHQPLKRSISTTSTTRPPDLVPPLHVGRQPTTTIAATPLSPRGVLESPTSFKQTPLQRHLAHLARHGITGVSSGPGNNGDSASVSAGSPHDSFVNVGNGLPAAALSNASVSISNLGSSVGSLKGRFSRFGSLNFGRRGGNS